MSNNLLLKKRGGFDEMYTPAYAVIAILKYLKPNSKILCPFDDHTSNYVIELRKAGHIVEYSHQWDGKNFFDYTKEEVKEFDYIISNPPYSIKDRVLEHLYKLGKPFMILIPIVSLAGKARGKLFNKNGIEVIVLDKRVNFMQEKGSSSYFNTSYFCKGILKDTNLVFQVLNKKENNELNQKRS